MTAEPERYPFVERDPTVGTISLAPLLPITIMGTKAVEALGLLDTGASVNVLPYRFGEEIGAVWEQQTISLPLAGNLATLEARLLIQPVRVGQFPVVRLAFAWARSDAIPLILGQMNFFLEFDVCFHRSRLSFEVRPKFQPPTTTTD